MAHRERIELCALAALGVACQQSAPVDSRVAVQPQFAGQPRVVVAVADTGINPYHAWFNASQPELGSPIYPPGSPPSSVTPDVLAEFGIDAQHVINLHRTGNPGADYAADKPQWDAVRPGEPYWFRGTNIIAVGRDPAGRQILPDDDGDDALGVLTTAAVLRENPEAIIFFVETYARDATSNDPGSAAANALAFTHPAVDIVSTSWGTAENAPDIKAAYDSYRSVVQLGKLLFSSAGNVSPCPTLLRGNSGPWWSIGVSGFYEDPQGDGEEPNGRPVTACYLADFVADMAQPLPWCATCEDGGIQVARGTSVSAPAAAGVASRVLLEARRRLRHGGGIRLRADGPATMAEGDGRALTNWQLRRALEEAAYVPTLADWDTAADPQGNVGPGHPVDALGVNEAAPWLQVGWGLLTADPRRQVAEQALAYLGFGEVTRTKAPGFCDFQTGLIEARHAYWDNVARAADALVPDTDLYGGDGGGTGPDPFVYCSGSVTTTP